MTTVTIVTAFPGAPWNEQQLAEYLSCNVPRGVGFTVTPSFGGGAGWPTEPGAVITFAGLTR